VCSRMEPSLLAKPGQDENSICHDTACGSACIPWPPISISIHARFWLDIATRFLSAQHLHLASTSPYAHPEARVAQRGTTVAGTFCWSPFLHTWQYSSSCLRHISAPLLAISHRRRLTRWILVSLTDRPRTRCGSRFLEFVSGSLAQFSKHSFLEFVSGSFLEFVSGSLRQKKTKQRRLTTYLFPTPFKYEYL